MFTSKILSDYHIISALVSVVAAWKWGGWRNWGNYYPTILFYIAGDLFYHALAEDNMLWNFESPLLKAKLSDVIHKLIFFPATILLFLPNYPKKAFTKQIIYVLVWVLIYVSWEYLAHFLGYFSYHNGWNIGWSILFNFIMFPLLLLHHRKPLSAIPVAFVVAGAIIWYFNIPFFE